jgi:hypothetical protein
MRLFLIRRTVFLIVYLSLPLLNLANASPPTAQEIVRKADSIRNPGQPFQVDNRLTEYTGGEPRNEVLLRIQSKLNKTTGQFRSLVRYVDPPRDRGKIVLFNGTQMWFYDPTSKTSVRITPQARLLGQASEGDVVTVNFERDYTAKLLSDETLSDADRTERLCWKLELSPNQTDAVYGRIEYWVEKSTFRPVKAKFFADSGKLSKIAYYHRFENHLGGLRPTETIIIDAVNSKLVTTMNLSQFKGKEAPDSWFQRDFLPRLTQAETSD